MTTRPASLEDKSFGELLTDGLFAVKKRTGWTITKIYGDIGELVGLGPRAIEGWRYQGPPSDLAMLEKTARFIMRHSGQAFDRQWLARFLMKGGHIRPEPLLDELFPIPGPARRPAPPAPFVPWDVPRPLAEFMGREAELAQLAAAVADGGRLGVIHGRDGMGKLTLAAQFADQHRRDYPGGAVHVAIGPAAEASPRQHVENALARLVEALGIDLGGQPSLPAQGEAFQRALYLRHDPTLIILEDVRDPADLEPLAPRGEHPHLFLITSPRAYLADEGDFDIALQPFDGERLPVAVALMQAIIGDKRLAVEARAEEQLRQLAEYVDGLPIALKLMGRAIRRKEKITLLEYGDRLGINENRFANLDQRLRAAVESGYAMLSAPARRAFAALSLFAGRDFSQEAAQAVVAGDEAAGGLAWLNELDDLALVQSNQFERQTIDNRPVTRLSLHRLLRLLAGERLRHEHAAEVEEIRSRFAEYYRCLIIDNRTYRRFDMLRRDWENVQAAMSLLARPATALAFHGGLEALTYPGLGVVGFLDSYGRWREAREWIAFARGQTDDPADNAHLAFADGVLAFRLGYVEAARAGLEEALRGYESLAGYLEEAPLRQAQVLHFLAEMMTTGRPQPEAALAYLNKAVDLLSDRSGAAEELGYTYVRLGPPLAMTGRAEEAQQALLDSLRLLPDEATPARASAYLSLGRIQMMLGRLDEAFAAWAQARADSQQLNDVRRQANAERNIANLKAELGQLAQALTAQSELLATYERMGDADGAGKTYSNLGLIHLNLGDAAAARANLAEALRIGRTVDLPGVQAHALINLAHCDVAAGDLAAAGDKLRQAEALGIDEVASEYHRLAAELALLGNSPEVALAAAELALEAARSSLEAAHALRARAVALSRLGPGRADEAEAAFAEATALLSRNPYETALTDHSYAKHLRAMGREKEAQAREAAAAAALAALGLPPL